VGETAPLQVEDVPLRHGEQLQEALKQALMRLRNTGQRFHEIHLLSDSPCTFLPVEQFRSSDASTLYHLTFPALSPQKDEVRYDILPRMEIVVVYTLSISIVKAVNSLFPEAIVRSLPGQWLEEFDLHNRRATRTDYCFYAQIEERQMLVAIFYQERLHYACTYPVGNDPDRLYFLLAVWQQMTLDGKLHQCFLRGASDVLTANIKRYVSNVHTTWIV